VKFNAKRFCGLVVVISLLSLAVLPFLSFSGRIDVMLPEKSGIQDIFSFLKDVQVSDKVLVTLSMRDGTPDSDILCASADQYSAALDPKLASPMNTGVRQGEIAEDFKRLVRQLPEYTDAQAFAALPATTSSSNISTSLSNLVKRLQTPEGMFASSSARSDPLDWNSQMIQKIIKTLTAFGYRAIPVQGHLMDPERKNLLLVLQTPIPMMDVTGVRALLAHLDHCAKKLNPAVEARLVCAHLHTMGNETIIRRDIAVTSIAVVLVFCVLFFGVYRDWRSGYVVLIPFLASLPALALSACFFKGFSALVVGFGSVIAGITIDYAIHAYVVSRSPQREVNLKRIRLPVILSALTTLCVFVAFCFSSIPAYRQLGCFASIAILVSLVYALVGLPHLIPVAKNKKQQAPAEGDADGAVSRHLFKPSIARIVLGCSMVAFALGLVGLRYLNFDANVSKLDGTPRAVIAEELRAVQLWGGGESRSAILSVEAQTEEEALRLNDALYAALLKSGLVAHDISSLSPLCPSEATRQQRRKVWRDFWDPARTAAFRQQIAQASDEMGFTEDAFTSFWSLFELWQRGEATSGEPIGFLQPVRERFIHSNQTVRVTTFVPDEPRVLAIAERVKTDIPRLKIVSRLAFSSQLSAAFAHEIMRVSVLAGVFILLVAILLIRRPLMIVLSLLPPLAGVIWGCAAMAFLGRSLDVSNLIAGIIVLGLCIDYGICMVFAYRDGMQEDVFQAVTLSAVTTVLGAGVLLLAKHPALFSIGVTLVAGVSAGYLCAWLTLRALYSLVPSKPIQEPGAKKGRGCVNALFLLVAIAGTSGCQTKNPFPEPPPFVLLQQSPKEIPQRFHQSLARQFEEQNALVFHYRWMDMAAVGIASVERETRSLAVTCMTPLGVKIFEVVCTNGVLSKSFVMPALEDKAGPIVTSAGADLMFAYFDLTPPFTAQWELTKTRLVFKAHDAEGVTEYRYAWPDGRLAEKMRLGHDGMVRLVEYRAYTMTDVGLVPTALCIRNDQRGYSIDVSRCKEESK